MKGPPVVTTDSATSLSDSFWVAYRPDTLTRAESKVYANIDSLKNMKSFRRLMDWGTLLLFGAGLSLGNLMFKTGLAETVGQAAFDALGTDDIWVITALAIAGGILLSEFTSNAATAFAVWRGSPMCC